MPKKLIILPSSLYISSLTYFLFIIYLSNEINFHVLDSLFSFIFIPSCITYLIKIIFFDEVPSMLKEFLHFTLIIVLATLFYFINFISLIIYYYGFN